MTITAIREKLHSYIDIADDKKVEAIYTIVENEFTDKIYFKKTQKIDLMKKASSDPMFLDDLQEVTNDFKSIDNENL